MSGRFLRRSATCAACMVISRVVEKTTIPFMIVGGC